MKPILDVDKYRKSIYHSKWTVVKCMDWPGNDRTIKKSLYDFYNGKKKFNETKTLIEFRSGKALLRTDQNPTETFGLLKDTENDWNHVQRRTTIDSASDNIIEDLILTGNLESEEGKRESVGSNEEPTLHGK